MEEKDGKKKKLVTYLLISVAISFVLGALTSYILNPKCGSLRDKSLYVIHGIQNLVKDEQQKEIIEVPIECNCPECSNIPEKEEDPCPIKVDVSGAVRNPGVYCLKEGSVIQDAVDIAKGFNTAYGYKYISRKINLAYELKDNQKIYFPFKEDLVCELQPFSPDVEKEEVVTEENKVEEDVKGSTDTKEDEKEEENVCINLNTATKEQLIQLTGVGESTAKKIMDARPFEKVEDILNVSGIGDATFEKIKDDICL
jgi:competence protein ComEA